MSTQTAYNPSSGPIRRLGVQGEFQGKPSGRGRLASWALTALLCVCTPVLAATAPTLGAAQSFSILGASTVTNAGPSNITGDLGVSPGSSITGFPPGTVSSGTLHAGDATAVSAQGAVTPAYNDLASQACNTNLTGQDLAGMTLVPGVYCFNTSAQLSGALTLNAQGDPNAVFIFQVGSTVTTASNASVSVINAGQSCNVFWQVGSSATLGTNTAFAGNLLAQVSITMNTGVSLNGRALARTGAVTLQSNTATVSICAAPVLPSVTVTNVSHGGVGAFTFTGNNGFANQSITTVTAGVGVAAATQTLTAAGVSTTLTESAPPAGYSLSSVSCTGLGAGGSASPNLASRSVTLDAAATAAGAAIACTFSNTFAAPPGVVLPTLTLSKVSQGGVGAFTFTGNNGFANQSITTVTAGVGVAAPAQTLTAAGVSTTLTESAPPAGYSLSSVSCTGLGAGGTASPNLASRSVTLDAAATAAGAAIACTFSNTFAAPPGVVLPTLTLSKVSQGGVGAFTFTGNNGFANQSITTVTAGVGVAAPAQTLTAAGVSTTLTESAPPAGYSLSSVSCTGLGAGGSASPNLASRSVTLDAAATAAGAAIACTFSNTFAAPPGVVLPTLTLSKVSQGGVGAFTFTGNNGFANQSITTVTAGVGVAAPAQTLTAAGVSTTLTESAPPAGYSLSSVSCTGLGAGGSASPNLASRSVTLDAAATAAGAAIACTFSNTFAAPPGVVLPTLTLSKVSQGGVGAFTFTGNNGFANQSITTVTAGVGVAAATQTLTAAGVSTTLTESAPPAGYSLSSVSCTGLGAGGSASPNLASRSVTLDAAATAAGAAIACTFSNTFAAPPGVVLPTLTLSKVSQGGVGAFTFTGNNGFANQSITTVTAGVGVAAATQTLTAAGVSTTLTESAPPAGYSLSSVSCTGLGAGGSASPNLASRSVTLDAAATAAGAAIACTFSNTFAAPPGVVLPTLTLSKVSQGGVGAFTFTGNNGFANQSITTVTAGVGVAAAAQTLTAAGVSTTLTESAPPAGYSLSSVSCTGLGAGGSASPNLASRSVTLDAAATAAGAAIACTFTNTATVPVVIVTPASIPTLSEWAMILLVGLMLLAGSAALHRQKR